MSEITLVSRDRCTGCGACAEACPLQCIRMIEDSMACKYPEIAGDGCIACGQCLRVCPELRPVEKNSKGRVYAAWHTDEACRKRAASGGVATAIYQYALKNRCKVFGVAYSRQEGAYYTEISNEQDIAKCCNSKYVYSNIQPILQKIKDYLTAGKTVILPALPCQAAAVRSFCADKQENLILIDIVCHGVCPERYLDQHVSRIEKRAKKEAEHVYFRDPQYGTNQFILSMYAQNKCIYRAKVQETDLFQIGYHKALNYRENCYHCRYTTPERVGDLTISDFSGLGRMAPYHERRDSVSCVVVSSDKGDCLWKRLQEAGLVQCEERPQEEAFCFEKQFQKPSVPHRCREIFAATYAQTGDYYLSAKKALKKDVLRNRIKCILHTAELRQVASKWTPKWAKEIIRKVVRR